MRSLVQRAIYKILILVVLDIRRVKGVVKVANSCVAAGCVYNDDYMGQISV